MNRSSIIDKVIHHPIASGLITSTIIALLGLLGSFVQDQFEQEHDYLIGDYYGYYYLRDGSTLVPLEVSFTPRFFKTIEISTKELNAAAYSYSGELTIIDGVAYSEMRGNRSDDLLFFVLRLPFNKAKKLPALNGVFLGLTQAQEPASTKLILSRVPMDAAAVIENLGNKPWFTVVDDWPKASHQMKASPESKL